MATGEDWNVTMMHGVAATSWLAAVYFVGVFFIMNTLMLNIVVSIIIESCTLAEAEPVRT